MQKYALLISYVGSKVCGWQKQGKDSGKKPSIQSTLEKTLFKITKEKVVVVASGRTDAGVNAVGQVAHVVFQKKILPEHNLKRALNTLLPSWVKIVDVKKVNEEFHAQHDALKKQYSYYLQLGPAHLAHLGSLSAFYHQNLDLNQMKKAAQSFVGEHDFAAFQASGAKVGTTIREIFECEITEEKLGMPGVSAHQDIKLIRIRVVGSGFLKQMVRSMVGTLIQIGEGKRPVTDIEVLLKTKNRKLIGPTAAPEGLWLERVWYKNLSFFNE